MKTLKEARRKAEAKTIRKALLKNNMNVMKSAIALDIHYVTLTAKCRDYSIPFGKGGLSA